MNNGIVFFFFILFNFLNPVSPILTIFFDLIILVFSARSIFLRSKALSLIVVFGFIIWIWSLIVMCINLHFETYIIFKYLRMPIMAILLSLCISFIDFRKETVINSIYYLCLINLIAIGLELMIPSTRDIIASILNISRMDAASHFDFRVLGIAGSFEFCSIMCIFLMVICYYKYKKKNSLLYLGLIIISFASMIFVSRTGMLIGAAILIFLMIGLYKSSRSNYYRILIGGFSFVGVFIAVSIVMPIIINSSGLFEEKIETKYELEFGTDYGSGTASALTKGSHLNILKEPIMELVFGYGINSENITTKRLATDIGYLEYICHIGIVGLVLVVLLHIRLLKYIFYLSKKIKKMPNSVDLQNLNHITIIYVLLLFVFNYKLMLLYSRGTFELMIILVFAIEKLYRDATIVKNEYN